ncbi:MULTISPECIES: hypothetical protein [unclassified Microbacterium]|uniref:hypothetical protein n=1 Tax=unclassified Microbacterium TaxID=2609290 RepID=UPI0030168284
MGYQVYEDRAARDLGVERWAGYGVPAVCDHPDCAEAVDRGLGYRCGDIGGEAGCGLSFCSGHLHMDGGATQKCERCRDEEPPFTPKPDTAEWESWMLTDDSWAQWRAEHPDRVEQMRARAGSEVTP